MLQNRAVHLKYLDFILNCVTLSSTQMMLRLTAFFPTRLASRVLKLFVEQLPELDTIMKKYIYMMQPFVVNEFILMLCWIIASPLLIVSMLMSKLCMIRPLTPQFSRHRKGL